MYFKAIKSHKSLAMLWVFSNLEWVSPRRRQIGARVEVGAGAGVGVGAGDPAVVVSGVGAVSATAFSPVTLFRLSFVCFFCARCSLL